MADTQLSNAFISLNDVINNFIISYTGPGKLIPDSKRTEVIFHARRCLQEFAYETLKSQFLVQLANLPATFALPADFVSTVCACSAIGCQSSAMDSPSMFGDETRTTVLVESIVGGKLD